MPIHPMKDAADEFVKDQQDRHADPAKYAGFRFPSPWFMKLTGGWGRDWICHIYAQPGSGKTSMLATAAVQFGKDKIPFTYISMEENIQITLARLVSNLEPVSRIKMRDIKLTQKDWPNIYMAAKSLTDFPGYIVDNEYTEAELEAVVKQTMTDVFLFDYYQLMIFPGNTRTEQMSNAAGWLQRLAKGKITGREHLVITAAQLNDNGEVLHSRDPDRHGDLNIEIHKIDDGFGGTLPDKRLIVVKKFKYGSVDKTQMQFIGDRSIIGDAVQARHGINPMP